MENKESNSQNKIIMTFAVISIFALIGVFVLGFMTGKNKLMLKTDALNILGAQNKNGPTPTSIFNSIMNSTIESVKQNLTERTEKIQENVMQSVENELKTVATSQIESIKYYICKEWGVISSTPSATPKKN